MRTNVRNSQDKKTIINKSKMIRLMLITTKNYSVNFAVLCFTQQKIEAVFPVLE